MLSLAFNQSFEGTDGCVRPRWHNRNLSQFEEMPEGRTIFHEIIRSNSLPEKEKETQRIADEAMVVLSAGTGTMASKLAAIMGHMLFYRKLIPA